MAIEAIGTVYRGHHMRSRLEARWAVFLDRAGIGWSYEPEGLRVIWRGRSVSWLPDFWLGTDQWAEVKGALSTEEAQRLVHIAMGVSDCPGTDLVVLGHIPQEDSMRWPVQLHRHSTSLWAVPWTQLPGCPLGGVRMLIPNDAAPDTRLLLSGMLAGQPEWAEPALSYARQARFEHGQSG